MKTYLHTISYGMIYIHTMAARAMHRQPDLTLLLLSASLLHYTHKNILLILGASARSQEEEDGEVWRRRQSMQASGGVTQNQEACSARESQNGAVGVERETGEMQDDLGCFFALFFQ